MQVSSTSQNLLSLVQNPFQSVQGCTYQADQLFALVCPEQSVVMITDAKSVLNQNNCVRNCFNANSTISPEPEYQVTENLLQLNSMQQINVQEFAVSAINLNSTLELIYYDMKKIKEEN